MLSEQLKKSIAFLHFHNVIIQSGQLGHLFTGMLYFLGLVPSAQWQLEGMIFYHNQNHLIKVVRTFLILSCY
jgi:hypothetical protein